MFYAVIGEGARLPGEGTEARYVTAW